MQTAATRHEDDPLQPINQTRNVNVNVNVGLASCFLFFLPFNVIYRMCGPYETEGKPETHGNFQGLWALSAMGRGEGWRVL